MTGIGTPRPEEFPTRAVFGACVVSLLLRLRFIGAPLSVDETGYLSIARLWNNGARLYGEAWVDRPVGLLWTYRLGVMLHLDTQWPRIVAAFFGVVMTACLARAVHHWGFGSFATGSTAVLFAVISVAPRLEGFVANGELLGAGPNAVAVWLLAPWLVGRSMSRWRLVGAGCAAAAGLCMRQGSMDVGMALATVIVVLLVLRATGAVRARRDPASSGVVDDTPTASKLFSAGGCFALGALIPIAATVAHGLWSDANGWWFAMVAYRGSTDSIFKGPYGARAAAFLASLNPALLSLGVLILLVPLALGGSAPRTLRLFIGSWLGWSVLGFSLGGLFWGHYYVQLVPVLSVLGGIGAARIRPILLNYLRNPAPAFAGIMCLPLLAAVPMLRDPAAGYRGDLRIDSIESVGRAVAEQSSPNDRVLALWEAPGMYGAANRLPATRYLWWRGLEQIPGASEQLAQRLVADDSVSVVAQFQPFDGFEGGAPVEAAIRANFCVAERVEGAYVWVRKKPDQVCPLR